MHIVECKRKNMPKRAKKSKLLRKNQFPLFLFPLLLALGVVFTLFLTSEVFRSRDIRSEAVYTPTPTPTATIMVGAPLANCLDPNRPSCPPRSCYGSAILQNGSTVTGCFPIGRTQYLSAGSCSTCAFNTTTSGAQCIWRYTAGVCNYNQTITCRDPNPSSTFICGHNSCYGENYLGTKRCVQMGTFILAKDGCYKCEAPTSQCKLNKVSLSSCAGYSF